jgi:hypothetical protein
MGNSLGSYLYLKQAKISFFLSFLYLFSSTKSENKRAKQVLPGGGGGSGERVWEDEYGTNTVYTCM